jgi:hypothetical protein
MPESGGTCAHTAENGWRLSERPDRNVDNNPNHPHICVHFSLLFDDSSPRIRAPSTLKEDIIQAFYNGKRKPERTFGNVKADVPAD